MAVSLNHNILLLLAQSRLRETSELHKTDRETHRDCLIVKSVGDVSFHHCFFFLCFDFFSNISLFAVLAKTPVADILGRDLPRLGRKGLE